jgi:nitrite reductase/ring-hydroxylating ferredoxin subunit
MATSPPDPRLPIDARIDSPGREGLTGTAPANLYAASPDREQITIPPDFRPPEVQPVWRQDFPIDWPQDQYVERRDFLKFLVLTSGAFAIGQLWIAAQSWWRRRLGLAPWQRVAGVGDVAVGQSLMFNYPGEEDSCLLVRLGATDFVAFSQKCTHLSCAVIPKPSERIFFCPCHDGRFDLRTGAPLAGPPRRPLPKILLAIRGNDVYAIGVEERTV